MATESNEPLGRTTAEGIRHRRLLRDGLAAAAEATAREGELSASASHLQALAICEHLEAIRAALAAK